MGILRRRRSVEFCPISRWRQPPFASCYATSRRFYVAWSCPCVTQTLPLPVYCLTWLTGVRRCEQTGASSYTANTVYSNSAFLLLASPGAWLRRRGSQPYNNYFFLFLSLNSAHDTIKRNERRMVSWFVIGVYRSLPWKFFFFFWTPIKGQPKLSF